MTRYDAIVVGARVAGSATARCLARRGYRVLLVDKAHFPSDTISSHLVKARAIAYLDRWGLRPALVAQETDFRTAFSFTCEGLAVRGHATGQALRRTLAREHGWEELNDIPDGPIEWACVRRTVLDAVLVDAAAAAGVEIRQGFPVTELLRADDGRVVGVRGGDIEERATIVIGADGRRSRVAREVGARVLRESLDCGYTYYAYYDGVDLRELDIGVHLRGRLGLGYCPTNHGQAMISVWGPRAWAADFRGDLESNFDRSVRWCDPELAARMTRGRRTSRLFGILDQPNRVLQASGPGWALVGDAGYHLDQCTAIGITHALRSAVWLSDALDDGLGGRAPLDEATASYNQRVLDSLGGYFDYVCRIARSESPRPEIVGMFEVLGRNPELARRFYDFSASLLSFEDFYGPEGQALIRDVGGEPDPATLRAYRERRPSYEENPWAT
ncbi:MAG: NAD(P)/FAD-dependent oxidoreductase [Myxococcales bacterium]|nr:NAD(P)/FAD-dependent oxidoreductase [Myxococcales bacterium]